MAGPIWFSPSATRIVYSDASSSGYGGCHTVEVGPQVAHGQWSEYETSLSSTWADYISRIREFDDWMVNPQFFAQIDSLWGHHTVDRFAHIDNTQLPVFNSRFWCPGSSAVDTFTVDWAGEINWWVPPVYLVSRTLRHTEVCKAVGTLLVPAWKPAPFWPLLCPDGHYLAPFVHHCMFIPFHTSFLLAWEKWKQYWGLTDC